MDVNSHYFQGVTLLVTHYNRSRSLERLLQTFKDRNCAFEDIVVSDDGSKPEHLQALNELKDRYPFRLITTPQNKGLGNNINKGQDAVRTAYTLYIQEDFVPATDFAEHFTDALGMMEQEKSLDIVRFYAYSAYPYLKPYAKGFSEMLIKPWFLNYRKIYYYSDHPHLRRSSFFTKFGRYAEGMKGDKTEYRMCVSFIQNKGRGLFYDDFRNLFTQDNEQEPSTMTRSEWKQSPSPAIALVRDVYRQIKYNYDILFSKYSLK